MSVPLGIPYGMKETARLWTEEGQPAPRLLGSFFRAVLSNSLTECAGMADLENREALFAWAVWLYNDCPRLARGTGAELEAWHKLGGLKGIAAEIARADTERAARMADLDEAGTNMDPSP